jgi:hypothetical protein
MVTRFSRLVFGALLTACNGADRDNAPQKDANATDSGVRCPPEEDTTGPTVSFAQDLMPLFATSCAFSACHDGLTKSAGLYLGPSVIEPPATAQTPAAVYRSLLSPATSTPDLPRIAPGDPPRSFLFLKIEGCQNRAGLSCGGVLAARCGQRMPDLSPPLAVESRRLIARWIVQGAKGP